MLIPIRCWSCGKPIADKYEEFKQQLEQAKPAGEVLDSLGITRYCCRRMFLSQAELAKEILPYARY